MPTFIYETKVFGLKERSYTTFVNMKLSSYSDRKKLITSSDFIYVHMHRYYMFMLHINTYIPCLAFTVLVSFPLPSGIKNQLCHVFILLFTFTQILGRESFHPSFLCNVMKWFSAFIRLLEVSARNCWSDRSMYLMQSLFLD